MDKLKEILNGKQVVVPAGLLIGGALLLAVLFAVLAGLAYHAIRVQGQQAAALQEMSTALARSGASQVAEYTAESVRATSQARQTLAAEIAASAAGARATATAQAELKAIAVAQATASAHAQATATAQVYATGTAQAVYRLQLLSKVMEQMRQSSELTTAIFVMQAVVKVTQQNELLWGIFPTSPTELTYKAHGEVRAGFDLAEIKAQDVTIEEAQGFQIAVIRLPPPRILARSIDPNRSQPYKEDVPWFGVMKAETVEQAHKLALNEIVAEACNQEVLDQANLNAAPALAKLLAALGFHEVKVITQPGLSCP